MTSSNPSLKSIGIQKTRVYRCRGLGRRASNLKCFYGRLRTSQQSSFGDFFATVSSPRLITGKGRPDGCRGSQVTGRDQ